MGVLTALSGLTKTTTTPKDFASAKLHLVEFFTPLPDSVEDNVTESTSKS